MTHRARILPEMTRQVTIHPEMIHPEMIHPARTLQEMTRQVTCCSEHTGTTSSAVSLFYTPDGDSVTTHLGTDRQRRREPVAQYLDQQLPLGERI